MEGAMGPHRSVAEMTTDYLAAIRQVQPEGPYHLAGWSTGGVFAFAIARRIEAEGGQPGELLLFDSPSPSIFDGVDLDDSARFLFDLVNFSNRFASANMAVSYDELHSQDSQQQLETVLREAQHHNVLPAEVGVEHLRRLVDVCRAHVQAIMEYHLEPLAQPVHFFRPVEAGMLSEASGQTLDKDLGWRPYMAQLNFHEVPGDHFSMMSGENGRILAERIEKIIE